MVQKLRIYRDGVDSDRYSVVVAEEFDTLGSVFYEIARLHYDHLGYLFANKMCSILQKMKPGTMKYIEVKITAKVEAIK